MDKIELTKEELKQIVIYMFQQGQMYPESDENAYMTEEDWELTALQIFDIDFIKYKNLFETQQK